MLEFDDFYIFLFHYPMISHDLRLFSHCFPLAPQLLQLHVDFLARIVRRHSRDPDLAVRGEVPQAVLPGAFAHHGHHHGVEHGLPNLAENSKPPPFVKGGIYDFMAGIMDS